MLLVRDLDLITLKKNKYYRTFKVNLGVLFFNTDSDWGIAIGIFLYISLDFFGFQNSFCYICNVKEYI